MVREQHPLKRGQVVEKLLRRRVLNLRMIDERAERLLLKRRERARPVDIRRSGWGRAATPAMLASGPVSATLFTRRHHAPHVDERLVRHGVGRGIDEPDARWQREGDPDETVLAKIAEIAGGVAVGPEIVGIDRPKQRIVGVRIPVAPPLKESEISPRRWPATAGSYRSACGSRRTRARFRPDRPASGRETREGLVAQRRRARPRIRKPEPSLTR